MTKLHSNLVFLGLALLAAAPCIAAQKEDAPCPSSTLYENHNQVDYGPLKVRAVRGMGIVEVGDKTQPGTVVPRACLSLFTEKDHKLVASVTADSEGRFQFDAVSSGRYRLVARAEGFCTANVPLDIVKSSRGKTKIVVHFRPAGIDTCSYGELARTHGPDKATYNYDAHFACAML
jgi:Carboxypeptidase regulatory-like domain